MTGRRSGAENVVSLWEVVNWIAWGDFSKSVAPELRGENYIQAQWELYQALREGKIVARGIYVQSLLEPAVEEDVGAPMWWPDRIQWDCSTLVIAMAGSRYDERTRTVENLHGSHFQQITLERQAVVRLWSNAAGEDHGFEVLKSASDPLIRKALDRV